jgi:fructose-specific component phosphotransferase system IIB-like protein
MGQGKFKQLLKMLAGDDASKTNRQIIEDSNNAEVLVVTTLRPNKDKTKMYMDIDAIQMV